MDADEPSQMEMNHIRSLHAGQLRTVRGYCDKYRQCNEIQTAPYEVNIILCEKRNYDVWSRITTRLRFARVWLEKKPALHKRLFCHILHRCSDEESQS